MSSPPVIALTGNIASGKSTVARRLAARGAAVIDADQLAREVVAPGTPALAAVVARFGGQLLTADGTLDRAALRAIVFADADARAALEAITHPAIAAARERAVHTAAARPDVPLIVCDIPLLFEVGLDSEFTRILLVDAPTATRRERLIRDRGLSAADADAMIAAQRDAAPKRARATWVLDNDASTAALESAVDALWPSLLRA